MTDEQHESIGETLDRYTGLVESLWLEIEELKAENNLILATTRMRCKRLEAQIQSVQALQAELRDGLPAFLDERTLKYVANNLFAITEGPGK